MPGFDRTGPMGLGPRTGGGFGYCYPRRSPVYGPGYPLQGAGRGLPPWGGGRGRVWGGGRGRGGWRCGFRGYSTWDHPVWDYGPMASEEELEFLKEEAGYLENEMEAIRERIAKLEAKPKE